MNAKHLLTAAIALGSLTAINACARTPAATGATAPVPAAQAAPVATDSDASPATAPEVAGSAATAPQGDASAPTVHVHKSASCGCCGLWVEHMRKAGFQVEVTDVDDISPVKERLGVPLDKGSCHTAEVGGYFVEGHVPAEDVKRLLAQRPDARGLALPGMPAGSPGMELPDGRSEPYTVELVGRDGSSTGFASH